MQLKCVCKSWNLLITDPTFIKLHLKRSARNPHIAIMNLHHSWSITTLPVRSLFDNDSITLSENPNPYFHNNEGSLYFVGYCNGLLCFVSYFYKEWNATHVFLYLWNPATRRMFNKIVFIPDEDDKLELIHWYFVFGYDNSTNTYKVVAVCDNKVRIFNVGEDSNVWRNIQSLPVLPIPHIMLFFVYNLAWDCGLYVSGTINWFIRNSEYHQFVIISLDLSTEAYCQLKPPSVFDEVPNREPILAVIMDSLCFSDYYNETLNIWQMKEYGVEDSWTQILKLSYQNLPFGDQYHFPLCLSENDDILILTMPNDGNQPAFLYNFRDNRVEQKTRITNPISMKWYLAKYYVESMVSPI